MSAFKYPNRRQDIHKIILSVGRFHSLVCPEDALGEFLENIKKAVISSTLFILSFPKHLGNTHYKLYYIAGTPLSLISHPCRKWNSKYFSFDYYPIYFFATYRAP